MDKASDSKMNNPIWPNFVFIRDLIALMLTCQFDEDRVKVHHRSDNVNYGLFNIQGQITPKYKVQSCQNSNSIETLWLFWLPAIYKTDPIKRKSLSTGQSQAK